MTRSFLLVGEQPRSAWARTLRAAVEPLGELEATLTEQAEARLVEGDYELVVIDASEVPGLGALVADVHRWRPDTPIVVATASPSWDDARQVLLAGAADYIGKSLDRSKLESTLRDVLEGPKG